MQLNRIHRCNSVKMKNTKYIIHDDNVADMFKKVSEVNKKINVLQSNTRVHLNTCVQRIKKNIFDIYLLPVYIEGKEYQFIIDTGAQVSALMDDIKLKDGFHKNKVIEIRSVGGKRKNADVISLDSFFFSSVEVKNHSFVLLSKKDFKLPILNKEVVKFDGILGWDILSKIDFEIDDTNKTFSIIQKEETYYFRNLISTVFPICLVYNENHQIRFYGIDTGAHESWLLEDKTDKERVQRKAFGLGVHGIETLCFEVVKKSALYMLDYKIVLLETRTGNTEVIENVKLDGIFGNEIFKNKKIQFLNSKGIVRMID